MTRPVETDDLPEDAEAEALRGWRRWWKPVAIVVVMLVLFVIARELRLDRYLRETRSEVEALGPWGPLAFVLIYIVATVSMIPAWPLTFLAGALFHWLLGILYVSIGATVGAAICFLIARYLARDVVAKWVKRQPTLRKLNDLTEQHAAWMVAITRLVPIFPYNVINYAFGVTSVRFGTYVFWSWLCMLPGTVMYVLGGAAGGRLLEDRAIPWQMLGILAAVIVLVVLLTWFGRKQWRATLARLRAGHERRKRRRRDRRQRRRKRRRGRIEHGPEGDNPA